MGNPFGPVPQYDSGFVVVPQALLEHVLGVILEMEKHYQTSGCFAEDVNLAVGQLRAAIYQCEQ